MSKVKMEVFLSSADRCSDNVSNLLKEIEQEFAEKVEIIRYNEDSELFAEYNLTARPAVIIEELIRIIGFCPSRESLISALRDTGMDE